MKLLLKPTYMHKSENCYCILLKKWYTHTLIYIFKNFYKYLSNVLNIIYRHKL